MWKKTIDLTVHLFHIGTLSGCAHKLFEGRITEAFEIAVAGSICLILISSADLLASWIRPEE